MGPPRSGARGDPWGGSDPGVSSTRVWHLLRCTTRCRGRVAVPPHPDRAPPRRSATGGSAEANARGMRRSTSWRARRASLATYSHICWSLSRCIAVRSTSTGARPTRRDSDLRPHDNPNARPRSSRYSRYPSRWRCCHQLQRCGPGRRSGGHSTRPLAAQPQAEVQAEQGRTLGDERQVEEGAVPGDEQPGGERGEQLVQSAQDVALVAHQHLVAVHGGHRHREDRRAGRIEPVERRVRLDVEPVAA